jgi:hypothetical protein
MGLPTAPLATNSPLSPKRFTDTTTSPTTGSTTIPEVTFNLRYPGQYYDKESDPGCGS